MAEFEDVDLFEKTDERYLKRKDISLHQPTCLQEIGEVDEHVVAGFFLPACNVETDCNDVHVLAALCKPVFKGEGIHPYRCVLDNFG